MAGRQRNWGLLSVYILAVFNGEDFQPLAYCVVQDTIRPDTVGPHLVFLESAFQRLAFAGMVGQVAEGFLDSFADSRIEGLNIFDDLMGESDLLH